MGTPYAGDRKDNAVFGGGGFDMVGTAFACKTKCDHPDTKDSRGRRCVAVEHSSQDPNAVANCAFAWDCESTAHWSGGKVYRQISHVYEEYGRSQCRTSQTPFAGDRTDNPIFGGGGFDLVGTAALCKAWCDHPDTKDSHEDDVLPLSTPVKTPTISPIARSLGIVNRQLVGLVAKSTGELPCQPSSFKNSRNLNAEPVTLLLQEIEKITQFSEAVVLIWLELHLHAKQEVITPIRRTPMEDC